MSARLSRSRLALPILAAALVLAPLARAAAQDPAQKQAAASDNVPLPIPTSPAFTYLDASPDRITRPTSGRSLGAALVDGIDATGQVKQGIAFELAPMVYLGNVSLKQYRQGGGWSPAFILSNLKLSLGTVKSAGDSASTDLALGLRMTLFDAGDPLLDRSFTSAVGKAMGQCAPAGPDDPYSEETVKQCLADKTAAIARGFAKSHWNASSFTIAGASGLGFDQSRVTHSRGTGARAWATWGQQLGASAQLLLQGAYRYNRALLADSAYHALGAGARLLWGSERFNGFGEYGWEDRFRAGDSVTKKRAGNWSAGVEFLATQNLWISTGVGDAYTAADAPDRIVVFADIKWGLSQKARLAP